MHIPFLHTAVEKVKDKLKCKIVISLHYPDYIKECKINDEQKGIDKDPNEYVSEYKKVVNYFSHYVKKIIGDDEYRKFASYSEFSDSTESYTIAFPVLPQKYAKRDLIYIQNGKETYMSARLIKALREAGIKGIEFKAIGSLRFI